MGGEGGAALRNMEGRDGTGSNWKEGWHWKQLENVTPSPGIRFPFPMSPLLQQSFPVTVLTRPLPVTLRTHLRVPSRTPIPCHSIPSRLFPVALLVSSSTITVAFPCSRGGQIETCTPLTLLVHCESWDRVGGWRRGIREHCGGGWK